MNLVYLISNASKPQLTRYGKQQDIDSLSKIIHIPRTGTKRDIGALRMNFIRTSHPKLHMHSVLPTMGWQKLAIHAEVAY
ncbi:hypothetical protein E4T56_gene16068 [Termitomyces sp. T112]|nr:hypothetical protein E4T56_gene16068 [Termitomyces sp. T112]